jgi:glycosyltransferase 2 family protein
MIRRSFRFLPWIIGLLVMAWLIRSVSLEAIVESLRQLQWWQIAVLIVANLLVLLTMSGRWWILLAGQGYRLPFFHVLGYRLAVFGLSYFTPGPHVGGEPLQVLLVEKENHVPRTAAVAAVALDKTIELSMSLTLLFLGVGAILEWRILPEETGRQAMGAVGALLMMPLLYLGVTAVGFYPLTRLLRPLANWPILARRRARLISATATLEISERQIGEYYRRAPRALALAVLVSLLGWVVVIAEYWLMILFLGVKMTLPQLVTTLTAARLSSLFLLPAGLGALEFSQTFSFGLLGLDPAIGLSASLLIRIRDSLLGAFGLWWGSRHISAWGQAMSAVKEEPEDLKDQALP